MEYKQLGLKLVYRKTEELNPNDEKSAFKPLQGDEWNSFVANVKKKGILVPILIRKNGDIVDGRNRRAAALHWGFESVPCLEIKDNLTSTQEQELVDELNNARRHMDDKDRKDYIKEKFWDIIKTKRTFHTGEKFDIYKHIASKTAIPEGTVRRLITEIRKDEEARKLATGEKKIPEEDFRAGYREFIKYQAKEKELANVRSEVDEMKKKIERYAPLQFFKQYQKKQQKPK
jgi:hypothetical protein